MNTKPPCRICREDDYHKKTCDYGTLRQLLAPVLDSERSQPTSCGPAEALDNVTLLEVLLETYARSSAWPDQVSEAVHNRWVECRDEVLKRLAPAPDGALLAAREIAERLIRAPFPQTQPREADPDEYMENWRVQIIGRIADYLQRYCQGDAGLRDEVAKLKADLKAQCLLTLQIADDEQAVTTKRVKTAMVDKVREIAKSYDSVRSGVSNGAAIAQQTAQYIARQLEALVAAPEGEKKDA